MPLSTADKLNGVVPEMKPWSGISLTAQVSQWPRVHEC